MHRKILFLILTLTFVKELVWISVIPLWHFPDEQSHFGQLAYLAETGNDPPDNVNDLTEEIRKSEELLGTERDILGVNKFTYHPEYKIEYANNNTGKYENLLGSYSNNLIFRTMSKKESSRYPPFYYAFLGEFYRLMYRRDLILRVFSIRIIQSLFSIGTVMIAYLIARKIFYNDKSVAISTAVMVSFQPMFSFVSAGISSDNIGNFMFSVYLLIGLNLLQRKATVVKTLVLLGITFITSYFKPQFVIVYPLTIMIFLKIFISSGETRNKKILTGGLFLLSGLEFGYLLYAFNLLPQQPVYRLFHFFSLSGILAYFSSYAFPHLYREVLPWYWGIFDWLGITYPRVIHRIINIITLIGISGFVLMIIKKILNKESVNGYIFLFASTALLFIGIYLYDWIGFSQSNIHLGVQGRYFFPVIIPHMIFLLSGWNYLLNKTNKLKSAISYILSSGMILLNFIAIYTAGRAYYSFGSIPVLINQISQYKPWFFKGEYLMALWFVYLLFITLLLIGLYRLTYSGKTDIMKSYVEKN